MWEHFTTKKVNSRLLQKSSHYLSLYVLNFKKSQIVTEFRLKLLSFLYYWLKHGWDVCTLPSPTGSKRRWQGPLLKSLLWTQLPQNLVAKTMRNIYYLSQFLWGKKADASVPLHMGLATNQLNCPHIRRAWAPGGQEHWKPIKSGIHRPFPQSKVTGTVLSSWIICT